MKATTIKLDGLLLKNIESTRDRTESVTAFVKSVVEAELRRRKLRKAAEKYQRFLEAHPAEQQAQKEWDDADLASPPKSRSRK